MGKQSLMPSRSTTYIISGKSLVEQTDEFVRNGGAHLFIDEVHKICQLVEGAEADIRHPPGLARGVHRLVGAGHPHGRGGPEPSCANIHHARTLVPRILDLFHGIETRPLTLEEILTTSPTIDALPHPHPLFKDYLARGYYPFATDSQFETELLQVVSQTLEVDIPQFVGMNAFTRRYPRARRPESHRRTGTS